MDIFSASLDQTKVPSCFKTATIIPMPKKPQMTSLNDYQLIGLTPIMMKCFERLIKEHITSRLPATFDPFQFACWPNHSSEGAISTALHLSLAQLEEQNTHVQMLMLFLDFSSAFNTSSFPHLVDRLGPLGFSHSQRPQSVQVSKNTSSVITLSTGSPQGCVLLFTLMTHNCVPRATTNHIVKFADDTTVVGLIRDDHDLTYRDEVKQLVGWCSKNNLILNVNKPRAAVAQRVEQVV